MKNQVYQPTNQNYDLDFKLKELIMDYSYPKYHEQSGIVFRDAIKEVLRPILADELYIGIMVFMASSTSFNQDSLEVYVKNRMKKLGLDDGSIQKT